MKILLRANKRGAGKVRCPRGSFLVESTISLFLLVAIAVVLVQSSMNILRPRNWTMRQNLVDAFLSQEVALANRIDFASIAAGTSSWGAGTSGSLDTQVSNNVTMGLFPSFTEGATGRTFTASVHRVRVPIETSAAIPDFQSASSGTPLTLADLGIQAYELQSHVVYTLNGNTYVKSRTVVRSQ